MKVCAVAIAFVSFAFAKANDSKVVFRPYRISFDSLQTEDSHVDQELVEALTTTGMVSVTKITGFTKTKEKTLNSIHGCAKKSKATEKLVFPDGTQRLTLATHSIPNGIQKIQHSNTCKECQEFDEASELFRESVSAVTKAFAERLNVILGHDEGLPLLETKDGYHFNGVADVVENGEHLEHFHTYESSSKGVVDSKSDSDTIEWHTDQGMFLVFTPGQFVKKNKGVGASGLSGGFFVQLQDGTKATVEFDEEDELVILLGDGFNQYVNRNSKISCRATPHALSMPSHVDDETRVWYGRMVLPPPQAVHPEHGETFGKLRKLMLDATNKENNEILSLGCSSGLHARELAGTTCEEGTLYCWHRCMSVEEQGVSEEICAEQGLDLACINPRRQLWTGLHGDYFPACIDKSSAPNRTAYPPLPTSPRDEDLCTETAFHEFSKMSDYDHQADVTRGGRFMWSVVDGKVKGRLAYDGLFGWIAFGFMNPGGGHNGMNGANVVMALPGGNYSAVVGLDLSLPTTVYEYVIDETESAFRHWDVPVNTEGLGYTVEEHPCFTALDFEMTSINGKAFNLTGKDHLLWAANQDDFFVGYHTSRSRFSVEWQTGEVEGEDVAKLGDDGKVVTTGDVFEDNGGGAVVDDTDRTNDGDETEAGSSGVCSMHGAIQFVLATTMAIVGFTLN